MPMSGDLMIRIRWRKPKLSIESTYNLRLCTFDLLFSCVIMVTVIISAEITGLIDEIKNDKTHGASKLTGRAVRVLKVAAKRSQVPF